MGYSECDRFMVSLYYAYGCALLKKGSSEVRSSPLAMEDTFIPQVVIYYFLPHIFPPSSLFPLYLHLPPSLFIFHPSSLLTFFSPSCSPLLPSSPPLAILSSPLSSSPLLPIFSSPPLVAVSEEVVRKALNRHQLPQPSHSKTSSNEDQE